MNNFIDNIKKKKNLTCFCVFGFIPENEEFFFIFYCLIFMENHQYFIQSEIIIYKLIYLKKNTLKKKMEPFRRVSNEGGKKLDPVKEREKKKKGKRMI